MDKVTLGVIDIYFPDATLPYFLISQDFVSILKTETNYEAAVRIKKALRKNLETKLYNRIEFDDEGDAVILSIHKADVMFQVANIINNLAGIYVPPKEAERVKQQLLAYKKPKKQKWKQGDIFTVPVSGQTFALAQVLEKFEIYSAVCALFDKIYTNIPDLNKELSDRKPKAILTILSNSLDNHVYQIVGKTDLVIPISDEEEYDEIRYSPYDSSILIELVEAFYHVRPWKSQYDDIIERQKSILT